MSEGVGVELDTFVESVSAGMLGGIQKARRDPEIGKFVAPMIQGKVGRYDRGIFYLIGHDRKSETPRQATILEFDVQLAATSSREIDGSGKVKAGVLKVVSIEAGGGGRRSAEQSHLHRIRFSVPVEIPQ